MTDENNQDGIADKPEPKKGRAKKTTGESKPQPKRRSKATDAASSQPNTQDTESSVPPPSFADRPDLEAPAEAARSEDSAKAGKTESPKTGSAWQGFSLKAWLTKHLPSPTLATLAFWAIVLVGAWIGYWLIDKVFIYYTAASYIDEIAQVYDLNRHLASALTLAVFALLGLAGPYLFSLNKARRYGALGFYLVALIVNSLILWKGTDAQFFSRSGEAIKCYIVTRTAITYGNRPGIDPATGLQCRLITPEVVERIKEYESGRRPKLVQSDNPVFFDPRTGAAVMWSGQGTSGAIELFDLMGFHPQSGLELQPITRDTVSQWQKQQSELKAMLARRAPQRIDPDKFGFFDSLSGSAKVWHWRSPEGEYEFFDSDGFHHANGERLKPITAEIVADWKQRIADRKKQQEEAERQRRLQERTEAERVERERREAQVRAVETARLEQQRLAAEAERVERERREAQARAVETARLEQQRLAAEAAKVEQERQALMRAGNECDQLATNPNDARRSTYVAGVPYDVLKANVGDAIKACQAAVKANPSELRYQYQLARAIQINAPKDALPQLQALVASRYPAAFDNLGGLHIRISRNYVEAVRLFRLGMQLNDSDSIVSLAEMVERGHYNPQNPSEEKWQLLARAASLGHQGAVQAVQNERDRIESEMAQKQQQQETNRAVMQMFGTFLGAIPRR